MPTVDLRARGPLFKESLQTVVVCGAGLYPRFSVRRLQIYGGLFCERSVLYAGSLGRKWASVLY